MENNRRLLDLNNKMTGFKHDFKVLNKKEIDKNRSKSYKYLEF